MRFSALGIDESEKKKQSKGMVKRAWDDWEGHLVARSYIYFLSITTLLILNKKNP